MTSSQPPSAASGSTSLARLREELLQGLGSGDRASQMSALGLEGEIEDRQLARKLAATIASADAEAVSLARRPTQDPASEHPAPLEAGRVSYLMRLEGGASEPAVDLAQLRDLRTLQAVVLAGDLQQRRVAVIRLGEILAEPRGQPSDRVKVATEFLLHHRKWELAYELSNACSTLPGADGRRARAGRKLWDRLVEEVERDVRLFWDGSQVSEPLRGLHGDQRARLLARVRDLPEFLVRHLCATIEANDGHNDERNRLQTILALRNAADSRLLPSLRSLLFGSDAELSIAAARAIARTDDPRSKPALRVAYGQAVGPQQRLALAGALSLAGDGRGLEYVRQVLREDDAGILPYAVEAIRYQGGSDDVQRCVELLEHEDLTLVSETVKTLARIGDGRALLPLSKLAATTPHSGLRAEIEEAELALQARMELLGEEAPSIEDAAVTFDTTKMAAIAKRRYPATVRARASWCMALGYFWRTVGASRRALGRFEQAASLRPDWVVPVISVAMIRARHSEHPQALAAFRRALDVDRDYVEQHPSELRMLAQAFLRRAEAMENEGRFGIARGLLEEALALDLRKAPSGLRFALTQRHDALREHT